ncbi:hypothetical protein ACJ73_07401 [Blastomyces percursus]|uniref:Uncharacterized protein n=1 Tax=Blastomyces percursus TaxID=1658174 RepID=A0A1J9QZL4_9EURO|nr:hypothetical protein ACJ73_07401 [Blastomyces percursus]
MSPNTANITSPKVPETGPVFVRNSGGQCIVM